MNANTFEHQLIQLEEIFSKSRSNIYSDEKKQEHFIELYDLFLKIKNSDYQNFTIDVLTDHRLILNFIQDSLSYLDNSTLNVIPFEVVFCLEKALKDWVEDDNCIIMTSLSNKPNDFAISTQYSREFFELLNDYVFSVYSLKITKRIIRIILPKSVSRDYLSNVTLYHELGHFVDLELNISKKIAYYKSWRKHETVDSSREENHMMEFFADIFAAQYVSNSLNIYLNHLAFGNNDTYTHPSTDKRIEKVNLFLEGKDFEFKQDLELVLSATGSERLKIRFTELNIADSFAQLVPHSLTNVSELHHIFKIGWDSWLNSSTNFLRDFPLRNRYHIINNLIEKSISNFIVKNAWQSTKDEQNV